MKTEILIKAKPLIIILNVLTLFLVSSGFEHFC